MTYRLFILVLFCLTSLFAHAEDEFSYPGASSGEQKCMDFDDPYEKFNRAVFTFNSVLDHIILKPVARGYRNAANEEFRGKVSNAAGNYLVPLTMVNNVLQQEPKNALLSFWQFTVNTTFGIGGLENVAKKVNLQTKPQTFGSTLARYGVGPGPYIELPILGGGAMRDALDPVILNKVMNPVTYAISTNAEHTITGIRLVSYRSDILPYTDHVTKTSTDPYITIRAAKYQNRERNLNYPPYYKQRCKR